MKELFAFLALVFMAASFPALAKDKNTKLRTDHKSIAGPIEESGQKTTNLKQLRGMRPVNTQVGTGRVNK